MLKILMVDDDIRQTDSRVDLLIENGYEVDVCTDVDSAYEKIEQHKKGGKIHLIILDVMMPPGELLRHEDTGNGRDTGLFLYRKLLEKLDQPIPTIILSVRNDDLLKSQIKKEGGIVEHVKKPISTSNLIKIIKKYI